MLTDFQNSLTNRLISKFAVKLSLTIPPQSHLKRVTTLHCQTLECGPMPNLMVTLPNIGGALCSTPQSLADAHY